MEHEQWLIITWTITILDKKPAAIYLNNAINVKAHDQLWDIAHEIVEPVVDTCQNVDWFIVVPEKHRAKGREETRAGIL